MMVLDLDTREFNRTADQWSGLMKVNARKTSRWMMKRALAMILKFTPPNTAKQGKDSVERNLRRGFPLIDKVAAQRLKNGTLREKLERAIEKRNTGAMTALATAIYKRTPEPFSKDIYRAAVRPDGRAGKTGRITIEQQQWRNYLKAKQANVGKTRAGWNAAAGLVGLEPRYVKEFARRHGTAGGSAQAIENGNESYIVASNRDVSVEPKKYARLMTDAIMAAESNFRKIYTRMASALRAGRNPREVLSADIFD